MKLAERSSRSERQPGGVRRLPGAVIFCILGLLLFIVILLAVSMGSVAISFDTIIQILLNGTGLFHFRQVWDPSIEVIIWQVRMPGVLGAALVGTGLAIAGVLFQGILRNPLADPYLLGTSSGAALGAAIAFVLPLSTLYGAFFPLTPVLAFVGAILSVFLVYSLARTDGRTPIVTLLLAGVVINAVLVACQTLLLTLIPNAQFSILALFNWLSGGIAVTNWPPVVVVGIIMLLGVVLSLRFAGILDTFALGEESAAYLGLPVERYKLLIVIIASLITAAAVSISGLIGFVGLVVPHAMRLLIGPRHRLLLPASALSGAIFLTVADMLARVILAPAVLPVGVLTALVGAPFFLFLLRNSKRAYKW
ncbi:FecCD family ABC transporter permease [Ktedonosporobacter rubrisoli]|nr:iron chelate uptake ABC transporter family permease subunit [Ktedonosporobacter rubrisoli]